MPTKYRSAHERGQLVAGIGYRERQSCTPLAKYGGRTSCGHKRCKSEHEHAHVNTRICFILVFGGGINYFVVKPRLRLKYARVIASALLARRRTTYSSRKPVTTLASVEAFTFFPLIIARIVLRSSPVAFVVFRNPRSVISVIKLLLAATRPPS